MTKAGGSIQTFSESTHIEALIKACKMMKIKKKSYLYNSTVQGYAGQSTLAREVSSNIVWPEYDHSIPGAAIPSWRAGVTPDTVPP